MTYFEIARVSFVISIGLLCSACGTLPSGQTWGDSATIRPGWARVGQAARDAASDPWVWAPLATAAILQVDNLDRRTSDWAREHTPVFGSQSNAEQWSDDLRSTSTALAFVSLVATPGGDDAGQWLISKAKGGAVEVAAIAATGAATVALKGATNRERPNGADNESFPSGHTSSAAVHGQLAKTNLASIEMSPGLRLKEDVGIDAVVLGTAWARVEAGWHYPSDTLVGMALGTFVASFATRAFLPETSNESLGLVATDGGALLQWNVRF
jgi:membrane-associated phospholipid phosphatase